MATLNKGAANAMIEVGVNAATDVTGFGLLGHLAQMMKASGTSATVNWSSIPMLPGALDLAHAGSTSGGTRRNMEALEGRISYGEGISDFEFMVLSDAQTSGGLLISVPEERSEALIKSLVTNRTLYSTLIGRVSNSEETVGNITIEA
jgi:selenide,water dikinase